MHNLKLRRTLAAGWSALIVIMAAALVWTVQEAVADSPQVGSSEHLVTIYDYGEEQTLITKATTVEAALEQADIDLQPVDLVEPARDAELVAKTYHINIYRARPVTVKDGATEIKVMTATQSERAIAAEAGITLYDEDNASLSPTDNVLESGGAGLELNIDRATAFAFNLYGKTFTARTQAMTVGAMLAEKGVELGPKDGVKPAQDTPIEPDMKVQVWRNGKQTITVTEKIPMPTEEIRDMDREIGYREVKTPGKPGTKQVTYEIVMRNGKEVKRQQINSVTTKKPTKQVVIVGAKVPAPANPNEAAQLGHELMLAAGFPESQWGCLHQLWEEESGWTVTADNPTSDAYGIPQALPGSKMGEGWQYDAAAQIKWGLGYIRDVYGNPCSALNTKHTQGWY